MASWSLSAQITSSQISTPGSATLAPAAVNASQPEKLVAPNTIAIAITPCTNRSARRTTPTWQTSNADCGPRRCGTVDATTSKTVVPKPVVRDVGSPGT